MIKRAIILSLVFFAFCGCKRTFTPEDNKGNNKPIEVMAGSSFVIMLESNPTTGYSWQLSEKINEEYIKLIGSKFVGPTSKLIGAGGREFWSFKALKKGEAAISFKYVRPWEKETRLGGQETFRVRIK